MGESRLILQNGSVAVIKPLTMRIAFDVQRIVAARGKENVDGAIYLALMASKLVTINGKAISEDEFLDLDVEIGAPIQKDMEKRLAAGLLSKGIEG